MSADYEMYSWSKNHHRVSWPDGVEIEVHASNVVAMQIGQGRALLREIASCAGALSTASRRLREITEQCERDVSEVLSYAKTLGPATQQSSEVPKP